MLTIEEIQALSGAKLAAAIAKEEGWTHIEYRVFSPNRYRCPTEHHWIGIRPGELFPLVNTEDKLRVLPAYHEGDELGRLLEECARHFFVLLDVDDTTNPAASVQLCVEVKDVGYRPHITFEAPELPTAVARAYLWLKTNEEKSDDSHAEMDINLARIDQLRGGEE